MPTQEQRQVRVAVCMERGELSEALERALDRSGSFELVGTAATASELAGVVHTQLPDAVVIDERIAGEDAAGMLARMTLGRPLHPLVLVEDVATEIRRARQSAGKSEFLAKVTLLEKGLAARTHVAHALGRLAAASEGASKHTIPTDLLLEAVERRQTLAGRARIRVELVTLGSWPLDLIVLVGGSGNENLLAEVIARVSSVSVPVLVALRPHAAVAPAVWAKAKVPVTHLTEEVPFAHAEGILVAPRTGSVLLGPNTIRVTPGSEPLLVAELVRSTGAVQSGALTVLLGDRETDAAIALAGALDAGAVGAVLDPSATDHPAAPNAALSWGRGLVTLKPAELVWLLGNAVPRRT